MLERAGRFIEREFGRGQLGNQKEAIDTKNATLATRCFPGTIDPPLSCFSDPWRAITFLTNFFSAGVKIESANVPIYMGVALSLGSERHLNSLLELCAPKSGEDRPFH